MLGPGVAGMISAILKTCSDAEYDEEAEMGQSGCDKEGYLDKRQIQRRHPPPPISVLDPATGGRKLVRRIGEMDLPDDLDGGSADMKCHYVSSMRAGPRTIRRLSPFQLYTSLML